MNCMFNTPAILSLFVPIATTAIGTIIGWSLTRKKYKAEIEKQQAEADHLELEDLKSLIGIWQNMAKDIRQEYTELQKDFAYLKIENSKLLAQISTLGDTIDTIKSENKKLLTTLNQIKQQQKDNA